MTNKRKIDFTEIWEDIEIERHRDKKKEKAKHI